MKKIVLFVSIGLVLGFFSQRSTAQVMELEKTYEITSKAKRGYLGNVVYNDAEKTYKLTYVTKSTEKKAKFEHYYFDNDFNFIKMEEDEVELEKASEKYRWFIYHGELYSVMGNYVEPNMVGTLVLKKKKITYKYDWFFLGYYKTTEILEKVKPKTDDGRKFFYYAHGEDDVTGDIYVLCGVKADLKSIKAGEATAYSHQTDFVMLKFNADLELVKETPIKFETPQGVKYSGVIPVYKNDPENPSLGEMVFVFAPVGGPGMNKYADPNPRNYTYVRVDNNLEVKERIPFESPSSFWKVDEQVYDLSTGAVYLFGPSIEGKDKYYNLITDAGKYKSVQLMKVESGKIEYLTETNLDEFEAKLQKPPAQKKAIAYKGKKFQTAGYFISSMKEFYLYGQNFKPSDKGDQMLDIIAFHFDNKGVLKAQYGIDSEESNKFAKSVGAPQDFIESADAKRMYWLIMEVKDVTAWKGKVLSYPRIGVINTEAGTVGDLTSYGKESGYFLDPNYPFLETDKGNTLVFFGADKGGKTLWFVRVALK
ncbi:MAG: hypothetical protein KJ607_09240 [Bacteroidetes bacterium]|nr:hypothetical protein [Bacteroidota bacterium]